MAEGVVRTFKHDCARVGDRPGAQADLQSRPAWLTRYNEIHPHRAPGMQVPVQTIRASLTT